MISMSMLSVFSNEYPQNSGASELTDAQEEVLYSHSSTSHWEYDSSAGGGWGDWAESIALDDQGNAYITGTFVSNNITFGNIILNNSGNDPLCNPIPCGYEMDAFVAKLDPHGDWLWAIRPVGYGVEEGLAIDVDSAGHAYVTGDFTPISDGNGGQIGPQFGQWQLSSAGGYDGYIAKVSSNGQWLWALSRGGQCNDMIWDIDIGSNGDIYFAGEFGFSGPAGCGSNGYGMNAAVGKLNPAAPYGQVLWTRESVQGQVASTVTSLDRAFGVSVDDNGDAYITGKKHQNSTFDGMGAHPSHPVHKSVFTAKINSTGDWQWVNYGYGSTPTDGWGDVVYDAGAVYVVGWQNGTGSGNGVVHSLDAQNGQLQWESETGCGSQWSGTPICPTRLEHVEVDTDGDIYVTGSFKTDDANGYGSWLEVGGAVHLGNGIDSLLIAQLKPNGDWNWSISHGECGNFGQSNCPGDITPFGLAINGTEEIYIAGYFDHQSITLEDGMANWGKNHPTGGTSLGVGGMLDAFAAKYIRCPPGDVLEPSGGSSAMKSSPVQGGNESESLCGPPLTNTPVNNGGSGGGGSPPTPSLPWGDVPVSTNTPSGGTGCDHVIQGKQGYGDASHPVDDNTFYWDPVTSSWQEAHIVSFEQGWETVGWAGLQSGLPWNTNGWSWIAPDGDSANLAVNSPNSTTFAQTMVVPAEAYNIRVNYRAFADDFVSQVEVHSGGFTQNSDILLHSSTSGDNRASMIWGDTHWPGQSPMGNPWPSSTPLPIWWTPSSTTTPITISLSVSDTLTEASEKSGGLAFHWMVQYCLNVENEPEELPGFFETYESFNCPNPYYQTGSGAGSYAGDTQVRSNAGTTWDLATGVQQAPHWTATSSATASIAGSPPASAEWIWMDDPNIIIDNYVWVVHGFPIPIPASGNTQFTGGYANLHFSVDQTIVSAKIVDSGLNDLSQGGFAIPSFSTGNSHLADQIYSATVNLDPTATYQAGDYLYILILAQDWTDGNTYADGNNTHGINFFVETCFSYDTEIGDLEAEPLKDDQGAVPGFGAAFALLGVFMAAFATTIRRRSCDF